jgi:hypothetical protein
MSKPVNEMSSIEQMRHWIDIVDGKIVPKDGCEVKTVTESSDGGSATIVVTKKTSSAR